MMKVRLQYSMGGEDEGGATHTLPSPPSLCQGAPEKIVDRCTHYLLNGTPVPIDNAFKMEFEAAYERFGFAGERVLGFAYKEFRGRDKAVYKRDETSYPTTGLVFAGGERGGSRMREGEEG